MGEVVVMGLSLARFWMGENRWTWQQSDPNEIPRRMCSGSRVITGPIENRLSEPDTIVPPV